MSKETSAMSLRRFDMRRSFRTLRDRFTPAITPFSKDLNFDNIEFPGTAESFFEPEHLYVLVHGFNSKPGHLKYVAEKMKEKLGTYSAHQPAAEYPFRGS